MTRVIAGAARGRRLRVPPSGTRPTSDRAREGLFSSVESALRTLSGRRVLDLYAGSGAVGAEALSRGAVEALLVENDPAAAEIARANLDVVGRPGGSVSRTSVEALAGTPAPGPAYDLVFADPPYALPADELRSVLADLLANGWLVGALKKDSQRRAGGSARPRLDRGGRPGRRRAVDPGRPLGVAAGHHAPIANGAMARARFGTVAPPGPPE